MKHVIRQLFGAKHYYLVLVPVALLMFPNRGIDHDTRLYVFDILNIVHDGILANDFMAIFGTQNQYTVYAHLVAPLYAVFSPWLATAIVFVIGQLIWFSGLIALVARITGDEKFAFFGLLTAFLLPTAYFGYSVLSYGEPFATPRLFVEGLTFWALWSFVHRAYWISGVLVALATSLHPIMGLIAAALIIAMLLQEHKRWWWIFGAGSLAAVVVIFLSGAVPLERLTATMTGSWFDAVSARARYRYLGEWLMKDWARVGISASILLPMIALYTGWQRRLMVSALIVGGVGMLVSFIGTDLLHNVLLSQVQTSRTIWFAYLLGNVGMGVVVAHMYRRSEADGDAFFFLYLLAWMIGHIFWPLPGLVLGVVASGLAYLRIRDTIAFIPSLFRRIIYVSAIIFFLFLLFFRVKFWLLGFNRDALALESIAFVGIPGFTHMELVFIVLVIFVITRLQIRVPSLVTVALLLVVGVWSAIVWDRRSPEEHGMSGEYAATALASQIPQGAQVYWEGDAKGAWLLLQRPSFFSSVQGAGNVFSEALAAEFLKRGEIIQALDGVDYVDIWRPFKTNDELEQRARVVKPLARADIVAACANAPELDYLVLTRDIGGGHTAVWYPRRSDELAGGADAANLVPTNPRFLYRCADFR